MLMFCTVKTIFFFFSVLKEASAPSESFSDRTPILNILMPVDSSHKHKTLASVTPRKEQHPTPQQKPSYSTSNSDPMSKLSIHGNFQCILIQPVNGRSMPQFSPQTHSTSPGGLVLFMNVPRDHQERQATASTPSNELLCRTCLSTTQAWPSHQTHNNH